MQNQKIYLFAEIRQVCFKGKINFYLDVIQKTHSGLYFRLDSIVLFYVSGKETGLLKSSHARHRKRIRLEQTRSKFFFF